jgi:RNA polymerase sigma-70 factor (ECF subfamily)
MSTTRTSLLSRIKDAQDGPSWEEFDRVYRPMLLRYAVSRGLNHGDAEDIAQVCMAAISSGIKDFQRKVSFRGWLRGMVEHKVADRLRKGKHETGARTGQLEGEQDREADPALLWERQWNRTHLLHALSLIRNDIAPVTYEAFELYVIRGLPVEEIAERLHTTPNQIYVAKHRVIARLKKRWADMTDGLL